MVYAREADDEEETEVIDEIGTVPTVASVQQRINERYDRLFVEDHEGNRIPYVCTTCDEVLIHVTQSSYMQGIVVLIRC